MYHIYREYMKIDLSAKQLGYPRSWRLFPHEIALRGKCLLSLSTTSPQVRRRLGKGWKASIVREDLQVSLVKALLPEERPPGRSNSQRGGRHGPGESACRADAAGIQGGRAHATPASFQATDAANTAADADELYQTATGVGHRVYTFLDLLIVVHTYTFLHAIPAIYVSSSRPDGMQARFILLCHVTGRGADAYLHGWNDRWRLPRKGQGRVSRLLCSISSGSGSPDRREGTGWKRGVTKMHPESPGGSFVGECRRRYDALLIEKNSRDRNANLRRCAFNRFDVTQRFRNGRPERTRNWAIAD